MNNDAIIATIAHTAIIELIAECDAEDTDLNSDDFADYAQIIMTNSADADTRALAFDDATLTAIFNTMIKYCDDHDLDY